MIKYKKNLLNHTTFLKFLFLSLIPAMLKRTMNFIFN